MKRVLILFALVLFAGQMVFATIITNLNQSAIYIRLLARGASTDLDAVYYNPAGTTQLSDGFHLAIHNQTIDQEKTVINGYPLLNNSTYVGEVKVPIFPSVFAVYKKDKFALSFGFGPNSGGGSAEFADGLPSLEIPLSGLKALLTGMGIPTTAYSVDMNFAGKSVYYGFQVNAAYAFSEIFSAAVGFRYIMAENTYEGYLKDIQINPMHPLVNPTAGMMSAAQFFTIIGQPGYAAMVGDQELDAKQTGSAITPILSVNIKPSDSINIGIRYEFNTSLELENDTTVTAQGMFPDGEKTQNDIPAILSAGIEFALTPQVRAMGNFSTYFDKQADWDGREDLIDSNSYDMAFGMEFDLTNSFLLSAGILYTKIAVKDEYQSDISHDLSSTAFGGGLRYKLSEKLDLDLGILYVTYSDASRDFPLVPGAPIFYTESYDRTSMDFSVGVGYHF